MRTRFMLWFLVVCFAVPAGCAGIKGQREKLKITTARYNDDVRWGRLKPASDSVIADQRKVWWAAMERAAERFKIMDYELTPFEVGDDYAILVLDMTFMAKGDMRVLRQKREQRWEYMDGNWFLVRDIEAPRAALPEPEGLPDLGADVP